MVSRPFHVEAEKRMGPSSIRVRQSSNCCKEANSQSPEVVRPAVEACYAVSVLYKRGGEGIEMKRFSCGLFLLLLAACTLRAQAVDTTVCNVLKNPKGFDGKTVRIKGTVIAGLDEFVVTDGDCGKNVNSIWLAYPRGAKAKSGPIAMVELEPAHNFAGKVEAASRPAVTLQRDKAFKQFDSLLAQSHDKGGLAVCPGCPRYRVQATLVGRLDGVADATIQRDGSGKITGLGGFGNLNAYPARLVLESVAEVTPTEIDYSASDAAINKPQSANSGENDMYQAMADASGIQSAQGQRFSDPIATAQKLAAAMAPSTITTQIQADVALLPKGKEQNGVTIAYGAMNEVGAGDGSAGDKDSPDGVLYNCTFNRDRLPGLELTMAVMHLAQHVADIRSPQAGNENAPLFILENNAWAVTATVAVNGREKYLTLPGGYLMWNATWPDADKLNNMEAALNSFLAKEALLSK